MAWTGWLIPIALLLIGLAATVYLRKVRLPREETGAGVAVLAGMRWRDFIQLVLAALNKRGYERVFELDASDDGNDCLLERDGQRWLLWSRHDAAYVLGSTAIAEFANAIRLRGARGGLLVTPGRFAPEARALAAAQRIELLDGPTLWPELRPLLSDQQRASVSVPAQVRTQRQVLLAWGATVAVAALLLLALSARDAPVPEAGAAATPALVAGRAAQAATAPPASASAPAPGTTVAAPAIPTDPAQLEQHRSEIAKAISDLPGIDRALWSTQSTLLAYLTDENADPMRQLCPLLERHQELRASRVQLQPPAGSARPVRFVQCRMY